MDHAVIDRRAFVRLKGKAAPWSAARLRPGQDVDLVDLSAGGALIEAGSRLLPGTRVVLQLIDRGEACTIEGRVVRCHVHRLDQVRGVRYRGAIAFERRVDLPPGTPAPCG